MKSLKPDVKEQLKFEYKDTEQTLWLKKLMEPIEEQVRHACHKPLPNLCFPSSKPYTPPIHCLTLSLPCSLTCLHRIRVFMGRHRREGTRSLSKPACLMVLIQMGRMPTMVLVWLRSQAVQTLTGKHVHMAPLHTLSVCLSVCLPDSGMTPQHSEVDRYLAPYPRHWQREKST